MTIQRARLIPLLAGLVLVFTGGSHAAVSQNMRAVVHEGASIDLVFADGTDVGSQARVPPTIPPGTYTIAYNDDAFTHDFHLIGPGLTNITTTIGGTESGTWTVNLQPGSTYRFQCDDHADF